MYIDRFWREMHCLYEQSKQRRASRGGACSGLVSVSWGVGGRRFESSHADQTFPLKPTRCGWFFYALNPAFTRDRVFPLRAHIGTLRNNTQYGAQRARAPRQGQNNQKK